MKWKNSIRKYRGLLLGVIAVIAAAGAGYGIIQLAEQGSVESNLGDNEISLGDHLRLSEEIEEEGPILFPGLARGARDFYLQHLGEDPRRNWFAFDATRPGTDCVLVWNAEARWFEPPQGRPPLENQDEECAGVGIVEANGAGLRQYLVRVDPQGRVAVRFVSLEPQPADS